MGVSMKVSRNQALRFFLANQSGVTKGDFNWLCSYAKANGFGEALLNGGAKLFISDGQFFIRGYHYADNDVRSLKW